MTNLPSLKEEMKCGITKRSLQFENITGCEIRECHSNISSEYAKLKFVNGPNWWWGGGVFGLLSQKN